MDKNNKKYNKLLKRVEWLKDEPEDLHILIDDIYKKYIKDIITGKLTSVKDIKFIGKLINDKIIKQKFELWYA